MTNQDFEFLLELSEEERIVKRAETHLTDIAIDYMKILDGGYGNLLTETLKTRIVRIAKNKYGLLESDYEFSFSKNNRGKDVVEISKKRTFSIGRGYFGMGNVTMHDANGNVVMTGQELTARAVARRGNGWGFVNGE